MMSERGRSTAALLLTVAAFAVVSPEAALGASEVFCITSDYSVSGSFSTLSILPPWSVEVGIGGVHSDAVARSHGGLVYVVNRLYGDNIQVLDPSDGYATTLQFSVGPGSGPRDIAFTEGGRAYVSRYESRWLYEVDVRAGTVVDSVDLGCFADGDGLPEMACMASVDGMIFVALQRLDRDYYWTPVEPSLIAVIDAATNELVDVDESEPGVQAIALTATNPYTEILVDDQSGIIYVGEAGLWGASDGVIEAVDASTLASAGIVVTEGDLGGDIKDFTLPVDGGAFAVVSTSTPEWESYCVSFDWQTGDAETVWRPGGFTVEDIELHEASGQLFLCDRSYALPGVRVFDLAGEELTPGPLDVGLPPHDLLLVDPVWTGAPEEMPGSGFATAVPNPCRDRASLSFAAPTSGDVTLEIFDVSGRLVARRRAGRLPAGRASLNWDCRDDGGNRAASGVYLARVSGDSWSARAKLVVLRGGPGD